MPTLSRSVSLILPLLLAVGTMPAEGEVVAVLNTGFDTFGELLSAGENDANYQITSSADPEITSTNMYVTASTDGFPFNFPEGWFANGPDSSWIVPYDDGLINVGVASPTGSYVYSTTFDLTGYDVSTAIITGQWASDEVGTDLKINGFSTLQETSDPGFRNFTGFSISSGFLPGINTLEFITGNINLATGNPVGLRVEGQVNATPLGIAGDNDADGDVDGTDFLTWQREDGTSDGLAAWRQSYGLGGHSPGFAAAVPEPSTAAMLATALLCVRRR